MNKRATRANFEPFTAQSETESASQTTHGTRGCATMSKRRNDLPTTPAESQRSAKGFKPRHSAQAEKIRKHSRRHPCKPHATQTARTSRGDPPMPRRSRTPRPVGEGETPPRLPSLRKKPLSVPFLFFFGLYIYSLLFFASFFSFLASIVRKPRISS